MKDGDKIYIVTTGCYSSYRIRGVYTDKRLAEKAANIIRDSWESPEIETHLVNKDRNTLESGYIPFGISISRYSVRSIDKLTWLPNEHDYFKPYWTQDCAFHINVWARDCEHANKIATETVSSLIAANQWGPDHFPNERLALSTLKKRLAKRMKDAQAKMS